MTAAARRAYVLLADVVGSRDIDDREEFGDRLRATLTAATHRHSDALATDLAALKGVDEFGGVLTDRGAVYEVVRDLQAGLHPVAARYVVVGGVIDVRPDADDVAAMDGPAFHRADELLGGLPSEGGRFAFETGVGEVGSEDGGGDGDDDSEGNGNDDVDGNGAGDIDAGDVIAGDDSNVVDDVDRDVDDGLVTAAVDAVLALREAWTPRQARVARVYRERGTQTAAAEALGVTQQTVSRTLQSARYDRVARAERLVTEALST